MRRPGARLCRVLAGTKTGLRRGKPRGVVVMVRALAHFAHNGLRYCAPHPTRACFGTRPPAGIGGRACQPVGRPHMNAATVPPTCREGTAMSRDAVRHLSKVRPSVGLAFIRIAAYAALKTRSRSRGAACPKTICADRRYRETFARRARRAGHSPHDGAHAGTANRSPRRTRPECTLSTSART